MTLRTLTITAATAALICAAAPAQAQIFGNWGRPGVTRNDPRQVAYDNGYRDGVEKGEKALRDRRPFDIEREKDYRKADSGYHRNYGNKNVYRDAFRRGFAEGYRQAYARGAGYPAYRDRDRDRDRDRGDWRGGGSYSYPPSYPAYPDRDSRGGRVWSGPQAYGYGADIAFRNGQRDGYEKGLDDARHGRYPQPERQKWYREGDRHYDDDDGLSRDAYKDIYRRGFREGYARAFGARGIAD